MHPPAPHDNRQTVSFPTSQTACASSAELWLLLHDQLTSTEEERIGQHAEVCQKCQRRLEELTSPDSETAPTPGRIGHYLLSLELGRGSSGTVYLARSADSPAPIALKVLSEQVAQSTVGRERFLREVRALQSLRHPGIVAVRDAGEADGRLYFTMEYIPGGTLADFSQRRPVSEKLAAKIVARAAAAIEYCHQNRIIHRDLKPGNILLNQSPAEPADASAAEPIPRIADFGIARFDDDSRAMTETGEIIGTLDYMAPEQLEYSHTVTGAADVYSLGAILFELLTGSPPHRAVTLPEMISAIRLQDPPRLRSLMPGASAALELICERCLQKEPSERYLSAGKLADDLQRFLNNQSPLMRPVPAWRRVRAWSRRNPVRAGLILTVAVCAILVTAGSVIVARREQQHAQSMEEERDRTQRLFDESLNAYRMLDADIEVIVEKTEPSAADLLNQIDHILTFMEPLLEKAPERADYRRILANAWHYHSRLRHENPDSSSDHDIVTDYRKCIDHCDRLKRTEDLPAAVRRKFAILGANTRNNLGNYHREQQNWDAGELSLNEALRDWEELLKQSPRDPDYQSYHALATQNWVWLQWARLQQAWSVQRPGEIECTQQIAPLMQRLQSAIREWEQVFQSSPQQRINNFERYSVALQLEVDLLMLEENWNVAQEAIDRLLEKCHDSDNAYTVALEYRMILVRTTKSADSVDRLRDFLNDLLRLRKTHVIGVQDLFQSDDFAAISQDHSEIADMATCLKTHNTPPQ